MSTLYRVSGSGNDFLALLEPLDTPTPETIRAWCRRGISLGADGVFTLERGGGEAEEPTVRMRYWNADGGGAALCANATRCAARLAFELGWATGAVAVVTDAGTYRARPADGNRVALELPAPSEPPQAIEIDLAGTSYRGHRVTVGVPYLVLEWPGSLEEAPVASLGAPLRRHPRLGAAGANVDFVRFPARHRLEVRTFERGVEAETLASGTGVMAATLTGLLLGRSALPLEALTASGLPLTVEGTLGAQQLPTTWSLTGDARILAHLHPTDDAAQAVPPPTWSR